MSAHTGNPAPGVGGTAKDGGLSTADVCYVMLLLITSLSTINSVTSSSPYMILASIPVLTDLSRR